MKMWFESSWKVCRSVRIEGSGFYMESNKITNKLQNTFQPGLVFIYGEAVW